jgi:hypothetical protein
MFTMKPDSAQMEIAQAALTNNREIAAGALGAFGAGVLTRRRDDSYDEDNSDERGVHPS